MALHAIQLINHDDKTDVVASPIIAARERLDLGVKQLTNQNHFYSGKTKDATALFSAGSLHIGGRLNSADEAEGSAEVINNHSALIESLGKMTRNVHKINNTNDFFKSELQVVSDKAVDWYYIVPSGVPKSELRLDRRLLSWWSKSRGRNGWRVNSKPEEIEKPFNNDVQSNYLPEANQCVGGGVAPNCQLSVHSYYLPKDSAWQYFAIKPTMRENLAELLNNAKVPVEPVAPIKPEAPINGNAAAQQAYEKLLAEYHAYKALYDKAYQTYLTEKSHFEKKVLPAYWQWVKDNQNAFTQLNTAISAHNQKFASLAGVEYKDYWVTKINKEVIKENVVTQSQAGEILSGSDLSVTTDKFVNDKSRILIGGHFALNGNLEMKQEQGRQITETYGDKYYSYLKKRKSKTGSFKNKYKRVNTSEQSGLLSNPEKSITLPVAQVFDQYDFDSHSLVEKPTGESSPLPSSSLYKINPNADSHVLIETDPVFTDKKRWLSSDYMFNALRHDHNNVQKRLGDGYYEQRLVREQINQLTGRQYLGNYTNFDSQYKALMDAGITFAEKFNLRLGVTLSPKQVAQLTSDIVWFETKSVRLANGETISVLAPKVYAVARKGDIDSQGTLLSANSLSLNSNAILNEGRIAGREWVQFNAMHLKNSGTVTGNVVTGNVKGNVENIGGTIEANRAILLDVGGDFIHHSTTRASDIDMAEFNRTETALDRKALLHVKGENGALYIHANNVNMAGAEIINDGQGETYLKAQNHLHLTKVNVGVDENIGSGNHYRKQSDKNLCVVGCFASFPYGCFPCLCQHCLMPQHPFHSCHQ
ncbi:S-layer family protein [Pasteurella bettyae]|uniref:Uncharacterized protein n=1 Tax=Pasteurella bettyae CCUG 2042 TaxID=1095749 RepID=I3DGQ1_9PAST|nr:hypothetical protein HMPREF1052_2148 [Pasteurella bettyae CCUG 2042]SUB22689.1 protein PfhB1 [Pasteurella bettyae]